MGSRVQETLRGDEAGKQARGGLCFCLLSRARVQHRLPQRVREIASARFPLCGKKFVRERVPALSFAPPRSSSSDDKSC